MANARRALGLVGALAVVLVGASAGWWTWQGNQSQTGLLAVNDARILATGSELYAQQCAACHGANLEGQPNWQSRGADGLLPAPPHDETGHTWHHPTALLFAITKYGVAQAANLEGYESAMPAYDGILSDDEIEAVLAYIKNQWPEDLQERHTQLDERTRN
ncbi:MAG: cytochrome c [Pseudomonadota bacterium]